MRGSVHGRTVEGGGGLLLTDVKRTEWRSPPGVEDAAGKPACLSSYADVRFICKKKKKVNKMMRAKELHSAARTSGVAKLCVCATSTGVC